MRPDVDLLTTDRQSTFCKVAIKPDQIMICWRSDATRKCSVCAPMVMLEIYDVQFSLIALWATLTDPFAMHAIRLPLDRHVLAAMV